MFLSGVLLLPDPPPESVYLGAQLLRVRVEVAEQLGLELDDLVAVLKEGKKELGFIKKLAAAATAGTTAAAMATVTAAAKATVL